MSMNLVNILDIGRKQLLLLLSDLFSQLANCVVFLMLFYKYFNLFNCYLFILVLSHDI